MSDTAEPWIWLPEDEPEQDVIRMGFGGVEWDDEDEDDDEEEGGDA